MNDNSNSFFIETLVSLKQILSTCNYSFEKLFNRSFSVAELQHYKAVQLGFLYMNRLCNTAEYMLAKPENHFIDAFKSYDINSLINTISSTFYTTVSKYFPVKIDCYNKLSTTTFILTNESKFEFIILHLLLCCLKSANFESASTVKITFYVTETKDSVVFHIRDNNPPIDSKQIDLILKKNSYAFYKAPASAYKSIIEQSLALACKTVIDLDGRLSHTALKSGNRFDIYLPKKSASSTHLMRSPGVYAPDIDFYRNIVETFKLENDLVRLFEDIRSQAEVES